MGEFNRESESLEVVRLRQIEQELNERLAQQAVLVELSQHALDSKDLAGFMHEAVQKVAHTLKVDFVKILELQPGGKDLLLKAGVGWKEGLVGKATISAGKESQSGYALLQHEPVISRDLRIDIRFDNSPLLKEHGAVSGMAVIIPAIEGPWGVLGAHSKQARVFNNDDARFLQAVANLLASAIQRFETEHDLRLSRDQLEVILQGVADGITAQDQKGNLVYSNNAAAQIIGFPNREILLNTPIKEIMQRFEVLDEHGNPLPLEKLPGRQALKGINEAVAVVRYRIRSTGEERVSSVRATPVFNSEGEVELSVNIFHDITELKRQEQSQRLLAETGSLLSTSLDYATTLNSVASLAVKSLADWCIINVVEEDNQIRQIAVAHRDPEKLEIARELETRFPPSSDPTSGVEKVLETRQPQFYPDITDEMLVDAAQSDEHLDLMRKIGFKSVIILPLVARGRSLGAITLVWADSRRHYTPQEVVLSEELARRAALALDNARLFSASQKLNAELEQSVSRRTAQLQTLIDKLRSEISERKKVEEALRKNEAMLQSLFESAPDASILVDQDGKIIRVNTQAESIFGYKREELVGKQVEFLLPERLRRYHTLFRAGYHSEPHTRLMGADLQLYGQRKDGSEFPVDVMLSPLQLADGTLVITAIRDITERKQMEAELAEVQRRLIDSLEAERLYLAQELHDGAIQELYGISYQLKALENTLQEQDSLSDEVAENMLSTKESAAQVVNLLRNICGDLRPPSLAPFGLEKAIRAHAEGLAEKHPELDVQLDLVQDGQILPEHVRLALFRIYQHAVSNVLRHSQARHLFVRFTLDEKQIILEVKDDGRGFNVPQRWLELARGGHLGLVGTAERAQALGGQLQIDSSPGKGTLIHISVPRNGYKDASGEILHLVRH